MTEEVISMCSRCGKEPATDCGYGEWSEDTPISPREFSCTFPWDDFPGSDPGGCDYCPLIWCKYCKDELVVAAEQFIRRHKKTIKDDYSRALEDSDE